MAVIEADNDFFTQLCLGQPYYGCFFESIYGVEVKRIYWQAPEVVVTKSGKKTYGVERFFSSLSGKSVSGLSFFALSKVSVQQRHSFPVRLEQTLA